MCSDHRYSSPQDGRDLPHLGHQFIELLRIERLHTVGQRAIRLVMNFNHQSIRANRNGRAG